MDASVWITLALTLKVAGWATAINAVLGVAVGWLLARKRFIGRDLLDALLTLPLVLPPTVMGYYLLVVVGMICPATGPFAGTRRYNAPTATLVPGVNFALTASISLRIARLP